LTKGSSRPRGGRSAHLLVARSKCRTHQRSPPTSGHDEQPHHPDRTKCSPPIRAAARPAQRTLDASPAGRVASTIEVEPRPQPGPYWPASRYLTSKEASGRWRLRRRLWSSEARREPSGSCPGRPNLPPTRLASETPHPRHPTALPAALAASGAGRHSIHDVILARRHASSNDGDNAERARPESPGRPRLDASVDPRRLRETAFGGQRIPIGVLTVAGSPSRVGSDRLVEPACCVVVVADLQHAVPASRGRMGVRSKSRARLPDLTPRQATTVLKGSRTGRSWPR
jgi:hypothetical protein